MKKNQEEMMMASFDKKFKEVQLSGMRAGSNAMLGAILEMCNKGETVNDIKIFCENGLGLKN